MQKALLGRRLSLRPDIQQLQHAGIYKTTSAKHAALEQKLVADQLKAKLDLRPEQDELRQQGILVDQTPAQAQLNHDLKKRALGKAMGRRPTLEQIRLQGIYRDETSQATDLARNLVGNALKRALHQRPAKQELEGQGIMKEYRNGTATLERQLIGNQLGRALGGRTSREDLTQRGIFKAEAPRILEEEKNLISQQLTQALGRRSDQPELVKRGIIVDTLAIAFLKICSEDDVATLEQITSISELHQLLSDGAVSDEQMAQIFAKLDTDQDGALTFSQFLKLASELRVNKSRVEEDQREKAAAKFAETERRSSLSSILASKMSSRPEVEELKTKGIMQNEKSPAAVLLERNLIVNQLKSNLTQRPSREQLSAVGIIKNITPSQQDTETKIHKEILDRALRHRPSQVDLQNSGIMRSDGKFGSSLALERSLLRNALKNQLMAAPSQEELVARGILRKDDQHYAEALDQILAIAMELQCTSQELASLHESSQEQSN